MADLWRSARSFARTPALTLALVLSIAVGVGSTATIHGFARGLTRIRIDASTAPADAAVNTTVNGDAASAVTLPSNRSMTPELAAGLSRAAGLLELAAAVVLFIAAVNLALLLLARSSARSRETSIRIALGSSRAQLARLLLADGLVLTTAGAIGGLLIARWTAQIVPALFFAEDAEQLVFEPDLRAIVAVSVSCLMIVMSCGLFPLFEAQALHPSAVLQRENAGPSRGMRRVRHAMVVAQLTGCFTLVVSALLLMSDLRAAMQTRAGRHMDGTILATLEASGVFRRGDRGLSYFRDAERSVQSLPGVQATAWVARAPGARPAWQSMRVELPQLPRRAIEMEAVAFSTDKPGFVAERPVAGRMFAGGDTPASCPVALVDQTAADDVFGGSAVGRAIEDASGRTVEIVGVIAGDRARQTARHPTIYYYAQQMAPPFEYSGPSLFLVPDAPIGTAVPLDANVVSSSYFAVSDLSMLAGAEFADTPLPDTCRVAVVNQEAATQYFGGHAVGGAVIDEDGRRTTIVGVARSVRLHVAQRPIAPAIYLPMTQDPVRRMTMMIVATTADAAMVSSVRRQLNALTGGASVVTTLSDHLGRTALAPERLATTLVAALAAIALALGVIGVQAALAESARQRRREVAVRMAIGAQGWTLVRLLAAEGAQQVVVGALAGAGLSRLAARLLAAAAPYAGVPTPRMYLAAAVMLVVAATVAIVSPARSVLTVDPLELLDDRPPQASSG